MCRARLVCVECSGDVSVSRFFQVLRAADSVALASLPRTTRLARSHARLHRRNSGVSCVPFALILSALLGMSCVCDWLAAQNPVSVFVSRGAEYFAAGDAERGFNFLELLLRGFEGCLASATEPEREAALYPFWFVMHYAQGKVDEAVKVSVWRLTACESEHHVSLVVAACSVSFAPLLHNSRPLPTIGTRLRWCAQCSRLHCTTHHCSCLS